MKKLRLQFFAFFILLQFGILFLLFNSHRQMDIEEKSLWESESAKVYNQMQVQMSSLLNLEDARSFKEYRFFQTQESAQSKMNAIRSPLVELSDIAFPKGWVGYFQMDPDGSFSTPYLPSPTLSKSLPDYEARRSKQEAVEQATLSLRKEMKGAFANRSVPEAARKAPMRVTAPVSRMGNGYGGGNKSKPQANVYPNPILQKKENEKAVQKFFDEKKSEAPSAPSSDVAQLARREEAVQEESVKTFEQMTRSTKGISVTDKSKKETPAPKPSKLDRGAQEDAVSSGQTPSVSEGAMQAVPQGRPVNDLAKAAPAKSVGALKAKTPIYQKPKLKPVVPHESAISRVWLDPFQAKSSEHYLVFFRRVWVEEKMYLQGFVIQTQPYFAGLMQNSFENSDLPKFSWVKWMFENDVIAQYGQVSSDIQRVLFSRLMAYPLNTIQWKIMGHAWPDVSTRVYMNILFGGIFLFASFGLYWIYRSSAAQVRLSQKREDFVAAVTHELKTPLTSIRMYSEMLEDDLIKDESKRKEYYKNIHQESERLSRLIENVLQMARLEKQSYHLNLAKENPKDHFKKWSIQFVELASKEGFQFHLQMDEELPEIEYDPEALKEVLLILLENSMKFSRKASDKNLELFVIHRAPYLELIWKDHGPGVPAKEISQIFEKFYRVENELTRKTKGTGIGLAIAKRMAEEMGAKIEARNGNSSGLEITLRFNA